MATTKTYTVLRGFSALVKDDKKEQRRWFSRSSTHEEIMKIPPAKRDEFVASGSLSDGTSPDAATTSSAKE